MDELFDLKPKLLQGYENEPVILEAVSIYYRLALAESLLLQRSFAPEEAIDDASRDALSEKALHEGAKNFAHEWAGEQHAEGAVFEAQRYVYEQVFVSLLRSRIQELGDPLFSRDVEGLESILRSFIPPRPKKSDASPVQYLDSETLLPKTLETYRRDALLMQDIEHHLRYQAARQILHLQRENMQARQAANRRQPRQPVATPRLNNEDKDRIRLQALFLAADSLGRFTNLGAGNRDSDSRWSKNQAIFTAIATPLLSAILPDRLFSETPGALAEIILRDGLHVLNNVTGHRLPMKLLEHRLQEARHIILDAHRHGFGVDRLKSFHAHLPGLKIPDPETPGAVTAHLRLF